MFKLVILFGTLAIAAAAPSHSYGNGLHTQILEKAPLHFQTVETAIISEPSRVEIKEPTITKVGDIVQSVPSAVSHHSSAVVHDRENIVTPIIAPAIKTTLKTIETPVLREPTLRFPIPFPFPPYGVPVPREPTLRFPIPFPFPPYGAPVLRAPLFPFPFPFPPTYNAYPIPHVYAAGAPVVKDLHH